METFLPEVAAQTQEQKKACSMKSKPVIVTCLLAILSFFLMFTQTILNWIKNLSTDDRVWERAMELILTFRNSSTGPCKKEN